MSAPTVIPRDPQIRGRNGDSGGAASNDDGVLPRDVLYEILLRVPARPLCRFRTVCQSWRSLLSGPPFVAAHGARHCDEALFAVCAAGGSHGEVAEIKLLDTSGRVVKRVSAGPSALLRQMRPHLDLVLIRGLEGFWQRDPLRVLDPATGAVSFLPSINDEAYSWFVLGRAVSSTGGHDGEYKVLSLGTSSHATRCKVLTVGGGGSGTWRVAPSPPVTIRTFLNGTVISAKGVVYFLVDGSHSWRIAAFDLEAEQWRPSLVKGPVEDLYPRSRRLAEVNGRLAAISTTMFSTMDIWVLTDDDSRSVLTSMWCMRYRVGVSTVKELCLERFSVIAEPLWVLDDGRLAFWVPKAWARIGELWVYDPRTETFTRVAAMENCLNVGVGVYTGSLLRKLQ